MPEHFPSIVARMGSTLRSIDIRSVVGNMNDTWTNVLTIIRFSDDDLQTRRKHLDELGERWPKVDSSSLKICIDVEDVSIAKKLKTIIDNGVMKIGDFEFDLGEVNGLQPYRLQNGENYQLNDEKWPLFICESTHRTTPDRTHLDQEAKGLGFPNIFSAINSWLDTSLSTYSSNGVIIVVPSYAKILNHDVSSDGRVKVETLFHQNLEGVNLSIALKRSRIHGGNIQKTEELKGLHSIGLHDTGILKDIGNYKSGSIEIPFPKVDRHDYLDIRLIHTKPTGLDFDFKEHGIWDYWDTRDPAVNPLYSAFSRFCTEEDLLKMIRDPHSSKDPSKAFERIVSWLLSLSQLIVLRLDEHEKLRASEGEAQINSTDIIAYHENKKLLVVIACTIGAPQIEKDGVRIKEVAVRLSRDLFSKKSTQVLPVIFSSYSDLSPQRKSFDDYGVMLVDALGAEEMLNRIRRHDLEGALKVLGLN